MNPAPPNPWPAGGDESTPVRRSLAVSAPMTAALALALVHLALLVAHFAPAIMSPDANGYVVQARLIANEGRTSFAPESPLQYVGMHWLETEDGRFHSRYPAGLPLIMAAAWKVGGLTAALLVNPLLASATVLLVFLLARPLAGGWFAVLAAAVYAAIPSANQHALDADAHTGATFFLLAGVLVLRRFAAIGRPACGVLAGLLLGVVPAMRYPEAIAGLAIGAWLIWRVRPLTRVWPAVAGAALPIGALLVHNAAAYGAWWRTGYALTNEQTGFGFGYFTSHALPYLQSLGGAGLGLFFGFGAAGIAALVADRRTRADGVLFAGMVVPIVLVYMAYYFGGGGGGAAAGNLRFLIPTFPFFAAAGAWLLARLAHGLGNAGAAVIVTVTVLQMLVTGGATLQGLARTRISLGAAAAARSTVQKHVPAGSVLIVDRPLAESLDATGEWRLAEETLVAGFGPRVGPGPGFRPGSDGMAGEDDERPMPMQRAKNRAQRERYSVSDPSERRALAWADLAAWAGTKPVYWLARSVDLVANALPRGADYESIAEVNAPMLGGFGGPGSGAMPGPPLRGRPGPGGMPGGGFGPNGPEPGLRMRPGLFPKGGARFGMPGEPNAVPPKLRLVRITFQKD